MKQSPSILFLLSALICIASSDTATANDGPQWRGPDRSDVSKESGLLKSWPANGPKRMWLFENAGNAYAGPAIVGDKYFTLGTRDNSEILLILNADTGKELR